MILEGYARAAAGLIGLVGRHRKLLRVLARHDLRDEYVGHGLPFAWSIIHPLFLMLVYLFCFTLIFPARIRNPGGLPTDATIYLLSGIIPWITLTQVMSRSLGSIVNNGSIVKQITFPVELLPLKTLATPFLYGLASTAFLVIYGVWKTGGAVLWAYLWGLPLLLVLSSGIFVGLALVLGTIQVFTKDFREFVILFLNVGFFIHPILYLPDAIPAAVRPLIYLSPFSYLLFCWQDIFYYGGIARPWAWAVTGTVLIVLFAFGARLFTAAKPHFGDFL